MGCALLRRYLPGSEVTASRASETTCRGHLPSLEKSSHRSSDSFRRGDGPPVVFLHELASDANATWHTVDIDSALNTTHHTVLSFDLPGHGWSDKPRDPAAYGVQMVEDTVRLMDHLHIARAQLIGPRCRPCAPRTGRSWRFPKWTIDRASRISASEKPSSAGCVRTIPGRRLDRRPYPRCASGSLFTGMPPSSNPRVRKDR
jgi:hypothetical protein